jgi:D-glycero-D-manno-heptose 1,7-bisphosphate phosphatase
MRPTQAVILAGGRGTRLRPLTDTLPKPMIHIAGKPFLEHLIELLAGQGVRRIVLLLGYLPEVIQDYFGDGSRWGVRIQYCVSSVDDETGRRLKLAASALDPCFLLLYSDNYWPMQIEKMWSRFSAAGVPAMITVYSNRDGYTKDCVRLDDDGYVAVYDKSRLQPDLQGVEIGYAIVSKAVLDLMPDANVSFEETIYPQLAARRQLLAYRTDHRYYSIGSHGRLPLTETFLTREPAVILDRDGVLNTRPPRAQYVTRWEDFEWLPGVKEALSVLSQAGYRIIVVSNQAGIGRGVMTEAALDDIHTRMKAEALEAGGRIDAIYYCPHDWEDGCECRKPKPGMLFQAQRDFNLDLTRTVFVGDDERDAQAAEAAGCPSMLISERTSLLDISRQLVLGSLQAC